MNTSQIIVQCERCQSRFKIDIKLINKPQLRLRCSKCNHVFVPQLSELKTQPLARVLTFCNQKGGVAKTTSCWNVAVALSKLKQRVLCIDFDPQANLSLLAGITGNANCFYDVIIGNGKLIEQIQSLPLGLSLLPSNQRMNAFPKYALQNKDSEQILNQSLLTIKNQYDFILIDTPPSLKFFTLNAIVAADCILIPTQCAYLSMHGVEQIELVINAIRKRSGKPKEPKLLLTLYDANSTAAKSVYTLLTQRYAGRIVPPHIPFDEAIQEAQILQKNLFDYSSRSIAAQAYLAVAKSLLKEC